MSILQETFERDARSYREGDRWHDLQEEIRSLLEQAIADGKDDASLYVNYAAVLCNLGRYAHAIRVMREHPSDTSAYCQNMAIAIMNSPSLGGDKEVRYWNKRSSKMSKVPYEITGGAEVHVNQAVTGFAFRGVGRCQRSECEIVG